MLLLPSHLFVFLMLQMLRKDNYLLSENVQKRYHRYLLSLLNLSRLNPNYLPSHYERHNNCTERHNHHRHLCHLCHSRLNP
jgi:hypothetical protein